MKRLLLLMACAGAASAQITWTKLWPSGAGPFNLTNGYEDIAWDAYTGKVWIYSTNGSNSGDQIYSIRLHYFDPVAISDTNIGDNGQTQSGGCLISTSSWPFTHHTVGQFWVDAVRHRVYTTEGVGCTERVLEQWYYQLSSPISGTSWTETFPAGLAVNNTGEVAPRQSTGHSTTLSAAITTTTGPTSITLTAPGLAINNDFLLIDSEIVRVSSGGGPYLGVYTGGANPITIARGQYGTTATTHLNGATVTNIAGTLDNGKVIHDTHDDAFFWLGQRNDNSYGQLSVYCDTSGTGILSANQTAVGCTRPDDWVDITSKSICADATACAASAETGTNGANSGRLPHGWYYPSLDFDTTSNKVIFFAGGIYQTQYQYALTYTPATFTWTRLTTTCTGSDPCTGLLSISLTAGGSGYTSAPAVTVNGCTGATASATVSSGAVNTVTVTAFGSACSSPTISFGGPGTGATATAVANTGAAPPIYSSNSENTRIAHAAYNGKVYYHLSQHTAGQTTYYSGSVQDWVLDPIAQTWKLLQSGSGPTLTEAMTVDPATGNLYAWGVPTSGSNAEIWQGTIQATSLPTITTSSLPSGTQYSAYSTTLVATNSPTSWAVTGSLPTGMIFNTASGALSGTPTQGGSWSLSFTATNAAGASGPATLTLSLTVTPGLGASTYNCVDADGDGYGVGPGCLGPDADDTDATVHSATDVLTKYNTMQGYLTHMGWSPANVAYVDGGGGSCTKIAAPFTYDVTKGCATVDAAISAIVAGDAVMVRGGVYNRTVTIGLKSGSLNTTCSSGYTYYLAYPGELPDFEYNTNSYGASFASGYQGCTVIDGWKLRQNCLVNGTCPSAGGYGIANSSYNTNGIWGFVITHNDVSGFTDDLFPQWNQIGTKILHNYLHEALPGGDFGHVIYLGSDCPGFSCLSGVESNGTVIQGNVIANGWNTCIHANGPMQNITIDSNMLLDCHKPLLFQSGVSHSTITNNIVHTSGNQILGWEDYASMWATQMWQCHSQNANVVANNTFFLDGKDFALYSYAMPYAGNNYGAGMSGAYQVNWVADDGPCGSTFSTTASTSSGSPTITVTDPSGISSTNRPLVVGAGIPTGAYVTAVSGTMITLSQNATATSTGVPVAFNIAASLASTTSGSSSISIADATGVWPEQYAVGAGIPAGTTVVSVSAASGAATVVLSQNATATASGVSVVFRPDMGHNVYANNVMTHSCGSSGCLVVDVNTTGSTTSGSPNITTASGARVGDYVFNGGFLPLGTATTISGSGTSWVLSQNASATATGVPFSFYDNVTPGPVIKYSSPTMATTYLQSDSYINNLLVNFDAAGSIIDPGTGTFQNCSWFTNTANVPLAAGTLCGSDPQFVAASADWASNATLGNWNLSIKSGGAPLGNGSATYAPTYDAIGYPRSITSPTIGAYEAAGTIPIPAPVSASGAVGASGVVR